MKNTHGVLHQFVISNLSHKLMKLWEEIDKPTRSAVTEELEKNIDSRIYAMQQGVDMQLLTLSNRHKFGEK